MKRYKKFLFSLIFCCIFIAVVYPLLFYVQMDVPTEETRYLSEWIDKKSQYAGSIRQKKLLIISGSNTLFGIDAQTIETECKIPTVNMGTHAGLGMRYIFEQSKPLINSGDIILLPLEYEFYQNMESLKEQEFLSYIMSRDSAYFQQNDFFWKVKFVLSINPTRIVRGLKAKFIPDSPNHNNAYDSKYLNQNGDMTNYDSQRKINLLDTTAVHVFGVEACPSKESKIVLENFIRYCKDKKAILLATYPAYLYQHKSFHGNDLESIKRIELFYQENGIPILGSYDEFLYDVEDFYDTRYHLNQKGKEKRTRRFIHYLENYL